jgi:hypothetical protein
MEWLAFNPELKTMTPAISSEFIVKSRCNSSDVVDVANANCGTSVVESMIERDV